MSKKRQLVFLLFILLLCLMLTISISLGCCFLFQKKVSKDAIMPDPDLNDAVRNKLKKSRSEPLTIEDIKQLQTLEIEGYLTSQIPLKGSKQVNDLSGIEYAENLKILKLDQHLSLSDLYPISGLYELEILSIERSAIRDIEPIKELKNIKGLFLSGNNIKDVAPIAGLSNLETLDLSGNNIEDISVLENMKSLHFLALNHNQITDISSLAAMDHLEVVELDNNNIVDISALAGLESLTSLSLNNNQIVDISVLAEAKNLKYLHLGNNNITDISSLASFSEVRHLSIYYNQIKDFSVLIDMPNLDNLNISGNIFDEDDAHFQDLAEKLRQSGVRVVYEPMPGYWSLKDQVDREGLQWSKMMQVTPYFQNNCLNPQSIVERISERWRLFLSQVHTVFSADKNKENKG